MKYIRLILCTALLLLPCFIWADVDTRNGQALSGIKSVGGVQVNSCPSFYNASNVVFSWDGDHSSGNTYGCDSTGNAVQGTANNNPPMGTSYGENGSNGFRFEDDNENLKWTQTAQQYFDETASQTVWMRVNISQQVGADVRIFEVAESGTPGNNNFSCMLKGVGGAGTNRVQVMWEGNSTIDTKEEIAYPTAQWIDIAITHDVADTDYIAVDPGDGGGVG